MKKLTLMGAILALGLGCNSAYAAGNSGLSSANWIDPFNKVNPPGSPIIVCLNQANPASGVPSACDYGPLTPGVSGSNLEGKLIATGSITTDDPILMTADGKVPANPVGSPAIAIFSLNNDTSPGCPAMQTSGSSFWDRVTVSPDRRTLSWNYDKDHMLDLGRVCGQNNDSYSVTLYMQVFTRKEGASQVRLVPVVFSSRKDFPEPPTMVLPNLKFQFKDR